MNRLGDAIGLAAFQVRGRIHDTSNPAVVRERPDDLEADFLAGGTGISSDVSATVRGASVAQHAAAVLSHLCRDES